jgi:ADP-ribose pyrophosphatase YjhB (NUDIX family)
MIKSICSGGVVLNKKNQVAVVNQQSSSWSLPKGHVNVNEDLLSAAKREIFEETGISDLLFIKSLGSYSRSALKNGQEYHDEFKEIHMFLFKTEESHLKPNDDDNPEAIWLNKNDVYKILTHPKDKAFFKKIADTI